MQPQSGAAAAAEKSSHGRGLVRNFARPPASESRGREESATTSGTCAGMLLALSGPVARHCIQTCSELHRYPVSMPGLSLLFTRHPPA